MARRRKYYARRAYGRFRSYRRGRRGFGGGWKGMIMPVVGGAIDSYTSGMNIMGFQVPTGVGSVAVGYFGHNDFLKNIGAYQIGSSLPSYFGVGGNAATVHPKQ